MIRSGVACLGLALVGLGCSGKPVEPGDPPPTVEPTEADPAEPARAEAKPPPPADAQPDPAAAPARAEVLEATFVGDVIFGRYRPSGYDPIPEGEHEVFAEIAQDIRSDLLVGNLETPLVRDLPSDSPIGAKYRFGASTELARHLVRGGFAAMSLANNHTFDMREAGLQQTPEILEELGVVPLGAARTEAPGPRVETIERKGWKVGFVAMTARRNAPAREGVAEIPYLTTRQMRVVVPPLLRAARQDHDLLVVLVHWGDEYEEKPSYIQVKAAHDFVDAGADLVIGHHPHVLQGIERYAGGVIAYSLGNFLFENTHEIPRLTGVLRVRARAPQRCIDRVVFHPAVIKRLPVQHPVPATGGLGKKVRARVRAQSRALSTAWTDDGDDLTLVGTNCPPPGADPSPPKAPSSP